MPLSVSGRGGIHAWAPASAPCLPPAPTTTTVPGRVHPLLPATPALPPTRAAPSTAPTAPPVAPLPLPSDLAQMFDEPIGLSAAPTAPLAASAAPTVSSSSWLLDEIEVSDPPYVYTQLTCSHVRTTGLLTYPPAYSIEMAVEEAILEVDTSEVIDEVIEETIVECSAFVEAILDEAIEEVIEETKL